MYKFLALGGHKELNEVKKKLNKSDVDLMIRKLSELEMYISKNNIEIILNGKSILDFDYVWLTCTWVSRPIAYAVSLFLKKYGINFSPVEEEKSKLVDLLLFGMDGINLPDTYFTSTSNIRYSLDEIVGFCGYPFIVKPTRGLKGNGMFLVNSELDFDDVVLKLEPAQHYICQRFIPNNFDYRIILANGKVVSAVKRVRRSDTFRNNTHLGAEEFFMNVCDLPEGIIKLARDSTATLNLSWAGVDIVTCMVTGESYVLELNRTPGLTIGSSEVHAAYNHILNLTPRYQMTLID